MVLPLYLAMTDREMLDAPALPPHTASLGCSFSQTGTGLQNLPLSLPANGMLIMDDRVSFRNHAPEQIAAALKNTVDRLGCGSVLLDWERSPSPATCSLAKFLAQSLPCPVGMPPGYGDGIAFLPPCPLHIPLTAYLRPFQGREIWLETALLCETITVTADGTTYGFTPDRPPDGRYDEILGCFYTMATAPDKVVFTLFDTGQSLEQKLQRASLHGVTRAIGLYQEFSQKLPPQEK